MVECECGRLGKDSVQQWDTHRLLTTRLLLLVSRRMVFNAVHLSLFAVMMFMRVYPGCQLTSISSHRTRYEGTECHGLPGRHLGRKWTELCLNLEVWRR